MTESKDGPVNPPRPRDRRSAVPWVVLLLLAAWPFVSFLDHNREDAPVYWLGIAGYGVGFVTFLLMVTALGGLLLGRARIGRIANTLGVGAGVPVQLSGDGRAAFAARDLARHG